uniref:DP71L n=1 Tax=African swine fever virus TaxID=10497 RepID=A0A2S1KM45_ASF|nr:DP71L [African swine fever virus]AWF94068.1 DP71L [African swine fever virus]
MSRRNKKRSRRRRKKPLNDIQPGPSKSSAQDEPIKSVSHHLSKIGTNPTLAFILGGNEDLSDDSDWDENFSLENTLMPLNEVFLNDKHNSKHFNKGFDNNTALHEVNTKWEAFYSSVKIRQRNVKVHFATDDILVDVREADDIDRKSPWEQAAVDRLRFQRRITDTEEILSAVLLRKKLNPMEHE